MSVMISTVIFDLDDVLCHYDRHRLAARLAEESGCSASIVYDAIWRSGLDARSDRGEVTAEAYLHEISERIGFEVTIEGWLAVRRSAMKLNEEVLSIAKEISLNCRVAVLTNNSPLVPENMFSLCRPIASLFGEHIYASAQFRSAKPEAAVYLRCLDAMGVGPPESALFIDDLSTNIAGAVEAGLQGHVFIDAVRLRQRMVESRLLGGSYEGRIGPELFIQGSDGDVRLAP